MGRVATKGGITEEGIRVLREKLPEIFDKFFKSF
jgi:pyrroline-5-carboxylate reductase